MANWSKEEVGILKTLARESRTCAKVAGELNRLFHGDRMVRSTQVVGAMADACNVALADWIPAAERPHHNSPALKPVDPADYPHKVRFRLAKSTACHFPLWPESKQTGFVCGAPALPGRSWCRHCLTRVYSSAPSAPPRDADPAPRARKSRDDEPRELTELVGELA